MKKKRQLRNLGVCARCGDPIMSVHEDREHIVGTSAKDARKLCSACISRYHDKKLCICSHCSGQEKDYAGVV